MSERKTIQINPDLFKVTDKNTTRKKEKIPKIELKSSLKTQKQKTLRKNVLKMIREKQQEAYRELFDKKKPAKPATKSSDFDKDFDSSLDFFSSLANKVGNETPSFSPQNITFKNREPMSMPMSMSMPMPMPIPLSDISIEPPFQTPPIRILPQPQYGCLKNGSLPTFRTFTRKNGDHLLPSTQISNIPFMTPPINNVNENPFDKPLLSSSFSGGIAPKFIEQSKKFDKIHNGKINDQKPKQRIKYRKRKKIFKRTYRVGRSKIEPKISVLISNKTIRNRISTETQLLKQTPIQEVRRFLIKKGFIKVGTNAPNDVLRKMYETVSLVCGEIQNHNPENMLYNFIHDQS